MRWTPRALGRAFVVPQRRCIQSASSSNAPPKSWLQTHRDKVIHVCFSGALFVLALKLVNMRHAHEDMEADLRERLRVSVVKREAILQRVPALAKEAGLPAKAQGAFDKSLRALISQADEDLAAVAAASAPKSSNSVAATSSSRDDKPQGAPVW